MPKLQPLQWTVGHSPDPKTSPEKFVAATVPGAVQLDWARVNGWPDHNFGDNFLQYGWMEDVYWLYRSVLAFEVPPVGHRVYFICKGVDYQFQVRLGGRVLHEQEGMFTPVEIDLTDLAKSGDTIEVLVYPASQR
jgi:beta-mannosidase